MKRSLEIHIDELVLHGFSPFDKFRIGNAVQVELERLFAEGRIPDHFLNGGRTPLIKANSFQFSKTHNGALIGKQVANTIYTSLFPSPGNEATK